MDKEFENTRDIQAELNSIFEKALKEMDNDLVETLDHISKLSIKNNSQTYQITTTSGTIKESLTYAE